MFYFAVTIVWYRIIARTICSNYAYIIVKTNNRDRYIDIISIAKSASKIVIQNKVLILILILVFEYFIKIYLKYSIDIDSRLY